MKANTSTKKVYNFNTIRAAIVASHKLGNPKAIDATLIQMVDIDINYLKQWKEDVHKLRVAVLKYVQLKKAQRYDSVTNEQLDQARQAIYPAYKECLHCAEKDKTARELHVSERAVEDLVGFAWDFMKTGKGTIEVSTSEQIFRKKVESLLGCEIAKNELLGDHDRDILSEVYSARKTIENCAEKEEEYNSQINNYKELRSVAESDEFKAFIDRTIKAIEKQISELRERENKAQVTLAEKAEKAEKIEIRLKYAK